MKTTVDRISNGLYMLLAGFVLLWITLGFLKMNIIFQFLRLWPLLFIVVGIDVVFGKTRFLVFKIAAPLIVIGSVMGLIYVSQNGDLFHPRKVELSKVSRGVTAPNKTTDFNIDFSYGKLRVSGDRRNSQDLVYIDLSSLSGIKPSVSFKEFERENLIEIASNSLSKYVFSPWDSDHLWDVRINGNVPVKTKFKTYASSNKLDVSNLKISEFTLDTKFGSNEIIFGDSIRKASINSLGSKISILIPKEIGIKIYLNKMLIVDNFKELGLERGFKKYESPNYEEVEKRLDLDLNLKLSQLEIKFY